MAVPPSYADLGKSAKDIFDKGYGMIIYCMTASLWYHDSINYCQV